MSPCVHGATVPLHVVHGVSDRLDKGVLPPRGPVTPEPEPKGQVGTADREGLVDYYSLKGTLSRDACPPV